jgi:hypothetical protein
MQTTNFDPVIDRVAAHPVFSQLPACNDAVLAFGELRDQPVDQLRPQLTAHDAVKFGLIPHSVQAST